MRAGAGKTRGCGLHKEPVAFAMTYGCSTSVVDRTAQGNSIDPACNCSSPHMPNRRSVAGSVLGEVHNERLGDKCVIGSTEWGDGTRQRCRAQTKFVAGRRVVNTGRLRRFLMRCVSGNLIFESCKRSRHTDVTTTINDTYVELLDVSTLAVGRLDLLHFQYLNDISASTMSSAHVAAMSECALEVRAKMDKGTYR